MLSKEYNFLLVHLSIAQSHITHLEETFSLYYNVVQWFPHPYWGLRGGWQTALSSSLQEKKKKKQRKKLVDNVFKGREWEKEGKREICSKTTNVLMKYQVLIHMTHSSYSPQAGQKTKHIIIMWARLECSESYVSSLWDSTETHQGQWTS